MASIALRRVRSNEENTYRRTLIFYAVAIALGILIVALALVAANPISPTLAEIRTQGWVNALANPQLTVERQSAQAQLEQAGNPSVDPLLNALKSDNVVLRRNSADMLSYLRSPRAGGTLLNAMTTDPDAIVRENAAWALGELGQVAYLNNLNDTAVLDSNAQVRATAQEASQAIQSSLARAANLDPANVDAFAVAPTAYNLIYFASRRDLVVSGDGGKTWRTRQDVLPGQALTLAIDPKEAKVLYVGIDGSGLYKSNDGGRTWYAINSGLDNTPGARVTITAIAIDETNPQRILVAEGLWLGTSTVQFHPLGIFQSRDGGATWRLQAHTTNTSATNRMILKGDELYARAGNNDVLMMPTY
jgi:hypothetical protein